MNQRWLLFSFFVLFAVECSRSTPNSAVPVDAGVVPPTPDMAVAGDMTTTTPDMMRTDGGTSPAGPWPLAELTTYGAAQGLVGPILDASPDEAQNIWAISRDALFVMRPGQTRFSIFTTADGLHIQPFTDPYGAPAASYLTALAGGAPNQAFVGYFGYESSPDPFADTEEQRQLGNADKITLLPDGRITVTRYLFRCDYDAAHCWEDRSVRRMLYAHSDTAAGHLFLGMNHGAVHVFNDSWGDHIHVGAWYQVEGGPPTLSVGQWYGLALEPNGDLWIAGKTGVGLQPWNPTPHFAWVDGHFRYSFTTNTADHGLHIAPDYQENQRGIGRAPDGTIWMASLSYGLFSWDPASRDYARIQRWTSPGLPQSQYVDLAADLDGSLWLVLASGELLRFQPTTGAVQTTPGVSGVRRIYLDATVTPRSLYAATTSGLAVIR